MLPMGLQVPEGWDLYHKTVLGTRNPTFWVDAVMRCILV